MSALPAEHHPDATAQALYERYADRIRGFCANRLGNAEEAEDATQSTFLNALRALRRGTRPELEAAWLYAIARNVCRERAAQAAPPAADLDALEEVLPATRVEDERLDAIRRAVVSLPPAQRRAVLLREWQGLSYREIAEDLRLSNGAVEALLFRARRSLVSALADAAPVTARRRLLGLPSLLGTFKSWLVGAIAAKAVATTAAVVVAAATVAGAATVSTRSSPQRADPPRTGASQRPASVARAATGAPAHVTAAKPVEATAGQRREPEPDPAAAAAAIAHERPEGAPAVPAAAGSRVTPAADTTSGVPDARADARPAPAAGAAPPASEAATTTVATPVGSVTADVPALPATPSVKPPVEVPAAPELPAAPAVPAVAPPSSVKPPVSVDATLPSLPAVPTTP